MELSDDADQDTFANALVVGISHAKPAGISIIGERHEPLEEMDVTKQQVEDLSRWYEEMEAQSKADIKVLVREVKSLSRSHIELEKEVTRSLTEKSNTEKLLQEERIIVENMLVAREKLLSDCRIFHDRLKVNNKSFSMDEHGNLRDIGSSKVSDASRSDNQIEAQLVLGCDEDELRKIIADIDAENIKLRSACYELCER